MDFMALALRSLDDDKPKYQPYTFYPGDNFTTTEKDALKVAILKYEPPAVDAMFNNWIFGKIDDEYFTAKRATWNSQFAGSLKQVLDRIEEYYK